MKSIEIEVEKIENGWILKYGYQKEYKRFFTDEESLLDGIKRRISETLQF